MTIIFILEIERCITNTYNIIDVILTSSLKRDNCKTVRPNVLLSRVVTSYSSFSFFIHTTSILIILVITHRIFYVSLFVRVTYIFWFFTPLSGLHTDRYEGRYLLCRQYFVISQSGLLPSCFSFVHSSKCSLEKNH